MKGQYFSFDAIIASVIFVMALVALLSYWHSVKAYLDYQNDDLSREAIRISNLLFTPPSPQPTSCDTMNRFGLSVSWDDRRLDSAIISCAEGKDSTWLQQELGSSYPLMMNITRLTDMKVVTIGSQVQPSSTGKMDVVKIRRAATVVNLTSGETYPADIDLVLYRNK
jgi:hypothetical protein